MKLLLELDPDIHYRKFKELMNTYMGGFFEERQCVEGPVIFEGAQGLMLDELMGQFPHVTRSLTGLPQAIEAAKLVGVTMLYPVYVTRCYKTRHGAGALSHEGEIFSRSWKNTDATNVHNQFQGSIRFAPLNTDELRDIIKMDMQRSAAMAHVSGVVIAEPKLAVTCLDQIDGKLKIHTNERGSRLLTAESAFTIPQKIASFAGLNLGYASFGPTYKDVLEATDL
jgi:adenylosuccinate synthase